MKRTLLLMMLASACGAPEDAFVGRFEGTYDCSGSWNTGAAYTEGPLPQAIEIMQYSSGQLFMAGNRCDFPLTIVSAERAMFEPSECTSTIPTGDRVIATTEGGIFQLESRGNSAWYEYDVLIEFDGRDDSITAHCSFSGDRTW